MTSGRAGAEAGRSATRSVARVVVSLGVTALVTWFVMTRAGLSVAEVRALDLSAWTPSWAVLAASTVILVAGYVTTAYQWGWIVEGLGGPRLRPLTGVRLFMVSNLARYVPGKIWPIAGLAVLARPFGVSASTATAAAVMGQGTALLGAGLLGIGALPAVASGSGALGWLLPAAGIVLLGLALVPPVVRFGVRLWLRLARVEGEVRPPDVREVLGWLFVGLLSWVLYGAAFWALVLGLGFEAPLVPTASAFAAAYLLGYVAVFAPAGLGVREGFLVALLSPNLGPATGGAVAVVARLWTTLVEVAAAGTLWIYPVAASPEGEGPP